MSTHVRSPMYLSNSTRNISLLMPPLSCANVFFIFSSFSESDSKHRCQTCHAFGKTRRPNSEFIHIDGCRKYVCDCSCDGSYECPAEKIGNVCKPDCTTCLVEGEVRFWMLCDHLTPSFLYIISNYLFIKDCFVNIYKIREKQEQKKHTHTQKNPTVNLFIICLRLGVI